MEDKKRESEYIIHAKHNPKAHKLTIALSLAGLSTDIVTADIILRVQAAMRKMGGKFDMKTAIKIKLDTIKEYEKL